MSGPDRTSALTASQREIWALDRRTAVPAAVNLSYALLITGALDVAALAGAFDDVVHAHEPLRTRYPAVDGDPVAVVDAPEALELALTTVDGLSAAARLADADRRRGFDLSTQKPIRVALLRIEDGTDAAEHVLLVTVHHIAADGWSLYNICMALSANYAARCQGEVPSANPPLASCTDHADEQTTWLAGPDASREFSWWRETLRGANESSGLPGATIGDTGAWLSRQVVALPDDLVKEVRAIARRAVVSPFVALLSAFKAMLLCWTGVSRPILGTLAANRPTAVGASLLGSHYNPLLIATDLSGDPSLGDCLQRTAATMLAALDHQTLPYAQVVESVGAEMQGDGVAIPEAMFLMDRYPMHALRLTGCEVAGLWVDHGADGVPAATAAHLSFFVREVGDDRMTLSAIYRADVLDDGTVAQAIQAYLEILIGLCDDPQSPLSAYAEWFVGPPPEPFELGPTKSTLRFVTELAPVEVLSPVGAWADSHQRRSP